VEHSVGVRQAVFFARRTELVLEHSFKGHPFKVERDMDSILHATVHDVFNCLRFTNAQLIGFFCVICANYFFKIVNVNKSDWKCKITLNKCKT
jgi:hypothetical protein